MKKSTPLEELTWEHRILLNEYGRVQKNCTALIADQTAQILDQRARIRELEAEVVRLRGRLIGRDTALACARDETVALTQAIPGLPTRVTLARRVEALTIRMQDLMREILRLEWRRRDARIAPPIAADVRAKSVLYLASQEMHAEAHRVIEDAGGRVLPHSLSEEGDHAALEASLKAADLVICQTGCVSHDAYWRVQDHCKRTGKQCVLVDQPHALQFVRSLDEWPFEVRQPEAAESRA